MALFVSVHAYMQVCVALFVCVFEGWMVQYMCVCVCINTCVHVYVFLCLCVCVCVCVCMCALCVFIFVSEPLCTYKPLAMYMCMH